MQKEIKETTKEVELDMWDKQIIADYKAGKLTVLMEEAIREVETKQTTKFDTMDDLWRQLGLENPEDYHNIPDFKEV